ncbi:MAG: hypothetical protein ACM3N6_16745, partial [Betaproteobacteria bacterium]
RLAALAAEPARAESAPAAGAPSPTSGAAAFAVGQAVRVARFGAGEVVACDAGTVTIAFPEGRRRRFLPDYVQAIDADAPPPQYRAIVVAPAPP